MTSFVKSTAGAVAVVALLAAGFLAPAAKAGSPASPQVIAQATTTAPPVSTSTQKAPAAAREKKSPVDRVEARIADLHSRLKITDAQASQWDAFAQVMRDNAKAMTVALDQRAAAAKTASAVDDMRSYLAVTQAHADGMAKLEPAFENLYNAMSPDQQKNADVVFGSFAQGRGPRGSHKMPASAPTKP
jgi:hypothetical protein